MYWSQVFYHYTSIQDKCKKNIDITFAPSKIQEIFNNHAITLIILQSFKKDENTIYSLGHRGRECMAV